MSIATLSPQPICVSCCSSPVVSSGASPSHSFHPSFCVGCSPLHTFPGTCTCMFRWPRRPTRAVRQHVCGWRRYGRVRAGWSPGRQWSGRGLAREPVWLYCAASAQVLLGDVSCRPGPLVVSLRSSVRLKSPPTLYLFFFGFPLPLGVGLRKRELLVLN